MKKKNLLLLLGFFIGILLLLPLQVKAENKETVVITQAGRKTIVNPELTYYDPWVITIKNETKSTIRVDFSKEDEVLYKPVSVTKTYTNFDNRPIILYAGESKVINISALSSGIIFKTTLTMSTTVYKTYSNISTDEDKPTKINTGQTVTGPVYSYDYGGARIYYEFTLKEASTVTGKFDSPASELTTIGDWAVGGNGDIKVEAGKNFTWKLPAGTYKFMVDNVATSKSHLGEEYKFTLNVKKFNWGTFNLKWKTTKFVEKTSNTVGISVTGSQEKITFEKVYLNSDKLYDSWNKNTDLSKLGCSLKAGDNKIKIIVKHNLYGTYEKVLYVVATPKKPSLEKKYFSVGNKSLELFVGEKDRYVLVQQKSGSKWKTVKTLKPKAKIVKISGLKANKKYTYRISTYIPKSKTRAKKQLNSPASKSITVETGTTTKPSIKSISAKGKTGYVKKTYYPGHWTGSGSGRRWIEGYYLGGYYYTNITIKVTLRKKISNIKGIYIAGPSFVKACKGTGTTFTAKVSFNGRQIGKKYKIKVTAFKDATYGGTSPSVSKTVTVKK